MSLWVWESIPWLYRVFGVGWMLAAVLLLVYTALGPLSRALTMGIVVLIGTQCWYGPVYCISRSLRWYVVGILALRAVHAVIQMGRSESPSAPGRSAMIALSALGVLSATWASDPRTSVFLSVSFALGVVIIFFGLWRMLDRVDLATLLPGPAAWFALVVYGAGFAVTAIAWYAGDWYYYTRTGWEGRYSGVFINANMTGLLGATILPLVVAAPREVLGRAAKLRWPVVAMLAASIFLSGSRSALIGTLGALLLIVFYRNRAGAVALVALGGIVVAIAFSYARLDSVTLDESVVGHITRTKHLSTLSGRLELWEMGLDASRDAPILGGGWGASRVLQNDDFGAEDLMAAGGIYKGTNLHSAHVQLLVDLGWVGLVLFWIYCLDVLRSGVAILGAPRSARSETMLLVFASSVGMIADTLVHGGVFSIGSPSALVFWAFGTVCLKEGALLRARKREERWEETAIRARGTGAAATRPGQALP